MKNKNYIIRIKVDYDVKAKNEEDAYEQLKRKLDRNNQTAENEFWDNIEIIEE